MNQGKPIVLCFSGLDPTGGAGIQADIETLFSIGCHGAPVLTALTAQNTSDVLSAVACDPALVVQQSRAVLEDMPVQAIKIGLLISVECVEVIHTLLKDYRDIPVVLDPISVAGGGFKLATEEVYEAIREMLVPLTHVLTPNTDELTRLAPNADNLDACANELLEKGCGHVLLTGTHAQTEQVINRLYSEHQPSNLYTWPRLEYLYHGSGCTLAAAIAGYLAHRMPLANAIQQAQQFTWQALNHAERKGFGQHIPNRSFWNKQNPTQE